MFTGKGGKKLCLTMVLRCAQMSHVDTHVHVGGMTQLCNVGMLLFLFAFGSNN